MRFFTFFVAVLFAGPVLAQECGRDLSDDSGKDVIYCQDYTTTRYDKLKSKIRSLGLSAEQKNYALVVGISDYDHFNPLQTRNDAIKMVNFLLEDGGFDAVHLLTDRKATVDRVRELMITEFPAMVGPNDRFVFYWSGHGITRPTTFGAQGYLPLSDTEQGKFHNMVNMGNLENWDQFIQAKQVLYLLDSCFSGLAGTQSKSALKDLNLTQLTKKSRHLMTAGSQDEEVIVHDSFGGSIFTQAVIEGLKGDADAANSFGQDGVVSISELKSYVSTRVAQARRKLNWSESITPQLREMGSNLGEFYFVVPGAEGAAVDTDPIVGGSVETKSEAETGPKPRANIAFREAVRAKDERKLMEFIDNYPEETQLVARAQSLADKLFEDNLWQDALAADTIFAFEDYLLVFPDGRHTDTATQKIALLNNPTAVTPRPVSTPSEQPSSPQPTTSVGASGLVACRSPKGNWRVQNIRVDDTLNIRAGAGKAHAVIGELAFNSTGVDEVRCDSSGWCQMVYGCTSGYVFGKYLGKGNTQAASDYSGSYRVSHHPLSSKLNVRSGPGTEYPIVAEFSPTLSGVQISDCQAIDKFRFRWCSVKKGEIAGWAYGKYLTNESSGLRPNR